MIETSSSRTSRISGMARLMVGALLLQFVFGMYTNLFIALPRIPRSSGPNGFMFHMAP